MRFFFNTIIFMRYKVFLFLATIQGLTMLRIIGNARRVSRTLSPRLNGRFATSNWKVIRNILRTRLRRTSRVLSKLMGINRTFKGILVGKNVAVDRIVRRRLRMIVMFTWRENSKTTGRFMVNLNRRNFQINVFRPLTDEGRQDLRMWGKGRFRKLISRVPAARVKRALRGSARLNDRYRRLSYVFVRCCLEIFFFRVRTG